MWTAHQGAGSNACAHFRFDRSGCTAVFANPGYRDSRSLVLLWTDDVERQLHQTLVPHPLYMERKQRSRAFSDLGFTTPNTPITLSGFGEAERLDAARTTASIFALLGVSPLAGRSYSSSEERHGDRVAVVGRALAERRFGSATAAIGGVLLIDGEPTTVIGVMPASFAFPTREIQVWRPLGNRRARMSRRSRWRAV